MKAWRRSEPRIARPFFAISDLECVLDQAMLLVGDHGKEVENDVVQLDPSDFHGLHAAICPNVDAERVRTVLGDRALAVSLVLTLRDPMFKRRVMHERWPVAKDMPERIPLAADLMQEFGHERELHATLALVLDADLNPLPGWPSRQGAWIAKRTFKLKLKSIKSTFDIRKMTKDQAKAWTGFAGALVHVEYADGRLTAEPEDELPLAICFIAEEIHDAMHRAADAPLLQAVVMSEIVAAVLGQAKSDILNAEAVEPGTPLSTILEQLGVGKPMSLEELRSIIDDPVRLRAAVHDRTDLVKRLRGL